ncbi:hypothetical protein DFH07DRAFT_335926 [Mycena maculata]|uniref:Uncharacterized protein n=1 Tax=Mycena maculata TaxID=230809 RepID=A0AAD7NM61_9AGAR|nr:hypothetical protein DFH07DRAFT_335926 [Mycena maculata]
MYRLADAFGLPDLKALALESVRSQLSPENIVHEAFSSFTSLYNEIQEIEVAFLIQLLIQLVPDLTDEVEEMLKSICREQRPHSFNVLRKIVCRQVTQAPTVPRCALPEPTLTTRSPSPRRSGLRGILFSKLFSLVRC